MTTPRPTVGVLAARAPDAEAMAKVLAEAGLDVDNLDDGAVHDTALAELGCLLVTQEALTPATLAAIGSALAAQEPWSELPIVAMVERGGDPTLDERLALWWPGARLDVRRRPVSTVTLLNAVHIALHHRERQLQLRDHLALRVQMQREAHHRLQNLLATVQAMAAMSRRSGGDGRTALRDFEGRLRALASVHADLDGAGHSASSFARVAAGVLAPYGEQAETRITIGAVDDELTPDAGRTLALCLHELATNALKYGALADPVGRVELRFERSDGGARLRWIEHGAQATDPPQGQGYGTRYLERALGQLFASPPSLAFTGNGFRLDIEGPAPGLFAD